MPRAITLNTVLILSVSVVPTSEVRGAYRFNVKYALMDDAVPAKEIYRKEATYYSTLSGQLPVLPAALETAVQTFMASTQGAMNSIEGL